MFGREIALGHVQIRSADSARRDANQDLAGAGYRLRFIDQPQRSGFDRPRRIENDRAHAAEFGKTCVTALH